MNAMERFGDCQLSLNVLDMAICFISFIESEDVIIEYVFRSIIFSFNLNALVVIFLEIEFCFN